MIELLTALPVIVERRTPPPFGYHVGSTFRHEIHLKLPQGWRLDRKRLPRIGPVEEGMEVRRIELDGDRLVVEYQTFLPVRETRFFQLPAWSLFFKAPSGELHEYRLEPWRFALSPLIPSNRSDHDVELCALFSPPPVDLLSDRQEWAFSAACTVLFGALLLRWRQKRPAPLREAARRIPKLLRNGALEEAFLELHGALSRLAGFVVGRHNLEKLFQRYPALSAFRDELVHFFQDSEALFFAERRLDGRAEERLLDLARKLRTLEL